MKNVENSQINCNVRATSDRPQEACPKCGSPAYGFEDGTVCCSEHGSFVPEQGDYRLYGLRERYLAEHSCA